MKHLRPQTFLNLARTMRDAGSSAAELHIRDAHQIAHKVL